MNCHEYSELTPPEKIEFVGKLVHACLNDSKLYQMGQRIITTAEKKGLYQGVTINPILDPEIEKNIN